jgi:hypothetical protein
MPLKSLRTIPLRKRKKTQEAAPLLQPQTKIAKAHGLRALNLVRRLLRGHILQLKLNLDKELNAQPPRIVWWVKELVLLIKTAKVHGLRVLKSVSWQLLEHSLQLSSNQELGTRALLLRIVKQELITARVRIRHPQPRMDLDSKLSLTMRKRHLNFTIRSELIPKNLYNSFKLRKTISMVTYSKCPMKRHSRPKKGQLHGQRQSLT